MKKIIAVLTSVMLLVGMLAMCVSAATVTKSDLLNEAAKSPVYKYVKVSLENAARNVEITNEQAEEILPIVQRAVAILNEDHGPTEANDASHVFYTQEQADGVIECIDEVCAILGYTWKMTPKANPVHPGDGIFQVFDQNGKLVYEYDGDAVADTSAAPVSNADTWVYLSVGTVLLALGLAALAVSKKRIAER